MAYDKKTLYNWVGIHPLYTTNNQGFGHCSVGCDTAGPPGPPDPKSASFEEAAVKAILPLRTCLV